MFPQDIIIKILEYDGRIKYRNGKFINQLDMNNYKSLIKTINKKYFYQQEIKTFLTRRFYIRIVLSRNYNNRMGIILDYYYYGHEFMFSFYKDIRFSFWYRFTDVFYRYFRIYHPDYFITNYCFK
jgi:hypothetical protein